ILGRYRCVSINNGGFYEAQKAKATGDNPRSRAYRDLQSQISTFRVDKVFESGGIEESEEGANSNWNNRGGREEGRSRSRGQQGLHHKNQTIGLRGLRAT